LKFKVAQHSFSYIADTRYFDKIIEKYQSEL
jgi:hypothetical protein